MRTRGVCSVNDVVRDGGYMMERGVQRNTTHSSPEGRGLRDTGAFQTPYHLNGTGNRFLGLLVHAHVSGSLSERVGEMGGYISSLLAHGA